MPYAVIDKGSNYFDTNLYTGNNTARNITLNFSPDFVWIRSRDTAGTNHFLQDSVRGTSKIIYSNLLNAETTFTDGYVSSFNSDGYSLTTDTTGYMNYNARTYVGWSWRGSDSSAVSNTSGTITSTVSANTTSGFSIVSYIGTGATGGTIGHGLGVAPSIIIVKNRNSSVNEWVVYTKVNGKDKLLLLNSTSAVTTVSGYWGSAEPTSSVFGVYAAAGAANNNSGNSHIAYCFAEVKGFSKAFSYTGNGSTDGTFVYTGFKPAWVMVKASSTTGQWAICDNRRGTANTANGEFLFAESSEALNAAVNNWDFLSNGLKARANYAAHNTSGVTYIGMAFAENPFVSSKGIPCTAR